MPLRVKKSKSSTGPETLLFRRGGVASNSGQALIEYVLILIITVSLILALIAQVFKPMQTFVQSYMGDYVQCLLETGELPSFGYADAAINDESCAAKFGAASWNNNATPGSGSGSGTDKSTTPASASSSDSSSSSSGNSTYAGSSSRNGRSYFSSPRSAPRGVGDGGGNSKVIEIALDGGGAGGFFKGSTGGGYTAPARKVRAVGMSGFSEEERKKLAKKAEGTGKMIRLSDGRMPASKKTAVKKPEAKPDFVADDEPMTIGNFIRFLFIAALVIALLLFIGGQALQMSKSFEK
ncbi:hypothetical protein D3C87_1048860 [compost metagenome]